jgi:hypothetical protein
MNQSSNPMNCLTINEAKDILCAEHAGRLFSAETWWAIVPMKGNSYAETGDAGSFWALVTACQELGQPLGFMKVENKLGRLVNVPHNDPEQLIRSVIKPQPRMDRPVMEIVEARCKVNGKDPKVVYAERMLAYNEALAAENDTIDGVVKDIMRQQPAVGDDIFESMTKLGAFNEETGEYDEIEMVVGEWQIPIDRIIEFGERQVKFLANNPRVQDGLFGAENALWQGELSRLEAIVQKRDNEGEGEQSRAIDEALLDAAGMRAGGNSGK